MNKTSSYLKGLVIIQAVIAYEWLSSGWGKVWGPEFVNGMAKTLERFASQNPFAWYKDFLATYVAPNAIAFGQVIEWSEIFVGLVLFVAAGCLLYPKCEKWGRAVSLLTIVVLLGGMLMNANYYFAAGWTSPSTHGVNLVMFWVQAGLLYVWVDYLRYGKS